MANLKAMMQDDLVPADVAETICRNLEASERSLDSLEAICEEIGYATSHATGAREYDEGAVGTPRQDR